MKCKTNCRVSGPGNRCQPVDGNFPLDFSKILRFEAEKLGYTSSYTIYDTQDSKNMIKAIVKDMKLDDKIYKPSTILGRISMAKTTWSSLRVMPNLPAFYPKIQPANARYWEKSTNNTSSVANNRIPWISTIFCCKPISCSVISRTFWPNINRNSIISWSTNIRIPITPNTWS